MGTALVLSGGSTKLPLHVGALKALRGKHFDKIYSNSAGSILAGLLAIGYDYDRIFRLIMDIDFPGLVHNSFIDKMGRAFGSSLSFVPADRVEALYQKIFQNVEIGDVNTDLYIMTHSLQDNTYKIISKDTYPNMPIWLAVRMSSSVPLLFNPVRYLGKLYVDGGLSKDFPVDLVSITDSYIGHLIEGGTFKEPQNILQMAFGALDQLVNSNVKESMRIAHKNGIICRSNWNAHWSQFNIDLAAKIQMIKVGCNNMWRAIYGSDYVGD